MSPGRRRAVFLDRDGTLIRDGHYLADPEGVELIPGTAEALRLLLSLDYRLIVVTNQSGLARGIFKPEDYRAVAARVDQLLERTGTSVHATYFCPHHPDFSGECDCRKPGTGMHLQAAQELGIDLAGSWYIGDKLADVLPAAELQGRGILVRTGKGAAVEAEGGIPSGVEVVDDLLAASAWIQSQDAPKHR